MTPATTAGDVDGDGTDEVAIVEGSTEGGARVIVRDGATGDRVDTIELERFEDGRTTPGVHAETIPDQTGDGAPELGVVTNVGDRSDIDLGYYIVDPQAGEVLLSGDGRVSHFLAFDDTLGVVSPDDSVTPVDRTLDLSWEFDGDETYITRVYVDGYPVELTTDTEATVRLPPGEHTVQVRATNAEGITVYDTTTVEVSGESSMDLLLYGLTVAALAMLLVPYLLRLLRRR